MSTDFLEGGRLWLLLVVVGLAVSLVQHFVMNDSCDHERWHLEPIEHGVHRDSLRAVIVAAKGDAATTTAALRPRLTPADFGRDRVAEVALVHRGEVDIEVVDSTLASVTFQWSCGVVEQVGALLDKGVDDSTGTRVARRQIDADCATNDIVGVEKHLVRTHSPHTIFDRLRQQDAARVDDHDPCARQSLGDRLHEQFRA